MNMPGLSSKCYGGYLVDYGAIEQKQAAVVMMTRKIFSGKSFQTRNLFSVAGTNQPEITQNSLFVMCK